MSDKIFIRQLIRSNYENKRKKARWISRKIHNKRHRLQHITKTNIRNYKSFLNLIAPTNFSFISNTEEVILYFNAIKQHINNGQPVKIDISKITTLSSDTIVLLITILKDKKSLKVGVSGNAPENPELNKAFLESGIYEFVFSPGRKKVAENNKLWHYSTNNQVRGEIASSAAGVCKKLFKQNDAEYDVDNIYNLLVEAMSNTINHADKKKENINWSLNYWIDEKQKIIKYSFIDLGIGIFKSASFNSYRKWANIFVPGNSLMVKPFLEGRIKSSREKDNKISGKGIKQILDCAKKHEFSKFTIIANDQIINVKDQNSNSLNCNFDGTFIHFEITYSGQK